MNSQNEKGWPKISFWQASIGIIRNGDEYGKIYDPHEEGDEVPFIKRGEGGDDVHTLWKSAKYLFMRIYFYIIKCPCDLDITNCLLLNLCLLFFIFNLECVMFVML